MAGGEVGSAFVTVAPEAKGFGKALQNQVSGETQGIGSKVGQVFGTAFKVGAAAVIGASAAVAAGVGAIVASGVKFNSAMADYEAAFTPMLGSADAAKAKLAELSDFAAHTPFELTQVADASKTLLAFGRSSEDLMPDLQMLGDISQGNAQYFNQLSLVFGQVASNGKLMGQDLLQMINAGFNPLNEISARTGESMADLRKRMEQGGISFEEVRQAMVDATAAGGMFHGTMELASRTLTGQVSNMQDGLSQLSGSITAALQPALVGVLADGLNPLLGGLKDLITGAPGAQAAVDQASAGLVTSITNLGPAAQSLAGNLGTVFTALAPALQAGITAFVGSLATLLPSILTMAGSIVNALVQGIATNLPTLVATAIPVLLSFVTGLLGQLPMLINAGLQTIVALALGIAQALPSLIPQVVLVIGQIVQTLVDNLPMLLDAALQLILGLAQGLLDALPVLISALPQIIDGIITFLIAAIPMIIQAGIQLLVAIVGALPEIITQIVAALPQIITSIVVGLVQMIPQLVQAGVQLFVAIIQNLPAIISGIVGAIPQIISGIVSGIVGAAPQIASAGLDLMMGLVSGIKQAASAIWNAAKAVVSDAIDGVKNFLGIHSPSTLARDQIGKQFGFGVAEGLDASARTAVASARDLAAQVTAAASGIAADTQASLTAGMNLVSSSPSFTTGPDSALSSASSLDAVVDEIRALRDDIKTARLTGRQGLQEV